MGGDEMPRTSDRDRLLQYIESELAALREQYAEAIGQEKAAEEPGEGERGGVDAATAQAQAAQTVGTQIAQLEQVRALILSSPMVMQLIDKSISNYYTKALHRQQLFALFSNIVFLIAGWALSLLGTPASLAHLIGL
jgi:hypothetical protein